MFGLPRSTARGLHALAILARHGEPLTAGHLALELHVPPRLAARLLRALKAAGLVEPAGLKRWTLTRPAGEITVLEAAEALGIPRSHPERCPPELAAVSRQIYESLVDALRGQTLADLRAELPALP